LNPGRNVIASLRLLCRGSNRLGGLRARAGITLSPVDPTSGIRFGHFVRAIQTAAKPRRGTKGKNARKRASSFRVSTRLDFAPVRCKRGIHGTPATRWRFWCDPGRWRSIESASNQTVIDLNGDGAGRTGRTPLRENIQVRFFILPRPANKIDWAGDQKGYAGRNFRFCRFGPAIWD